MADIMDDKDLDRITELAKETADKWPTQSPKAIAEAFMAAWFEDPRSDDDTVVSAGQYVESVVAIHRGDEDPNAPAEWCTCS